MKMTIISTENWYDFLWHINSVFSKRSRSCFISHWVLNLKLEDMKSNKQNWRLWMNYRNYKNYSQDYWLSYWQISSLLLGISTPLTLEFTSFSSAENCLRDCKVFLRFETSKYVNTERKHVTLFWNIDFLVLSNFCTDIQTRDDHHVRSSWWILFLNWISNLITDDLYLIQIRDGILSSWNLYDFKLSKSSTSNVSHMQVHASIVTIRFSLGETLRERASQILTSRFNSTFKYPSSSVYQSFIKRTSSYRIFVNLCSSRHVSCRASDVTYMNLIFHYAFTIALIPSVWSDDLSNA